jgi:hypothetical protein
MNDEPIKITIDQEQIREQIDTAIQKALQAASWQLRTAADALDPQFQRNQSAFLDRQEQLEYDRGFRAGVESTK